MELVPPRAPIALQDVPVPKKEGFFARLFHHKKKDMQPEVDEFDKKLAAISEIDAVLSGKKDEKAPTPLAVPEELKVTEPKELPDKFSFPVPEEHPADPTKNVLLHPLPEHPEKKKKGLFKKVKEEPVVPDKELENLPPLPEFTEAPKENMLSPKEDALPQDTALVESEPQKGEVEIAIEKTVQDYFDDVEKEKEEIRQELEQVLAGKKTSKKLAKGSKRLDQLMKRITDINAQKFALHYKGSKAKINKKELLGFITSIKQNEEELASMRAEVFKLITQGAHEEAYDTVHQMVQEKKEELVDHAEDLSAQAADVSAKQKELDQALSDVQKQQDQLSKKEEKLQQKEEKLTQKEQEVRDREKMLSDTIKEKVEQLLQKRLAGEQKKLEKLQAGVEKEKIALEVERSKLETAMHDLEEKEHDLEQQNADLTEQLKKLEDALANKDAEVEQATKKLKEDSAALTEQLKVLKAENAKMQQENKKLQQSVKKSPEKDFSGYLQQSLSEIRPESMRTEQKAFEKSQRSGSTLYKTIDACKEAIANADIYQAQRLYTEAKSTFYSIDLHGTEKAILYNTIRELYNDIKLLMLEQ